MAERNCGGSIYCVMARVAVLEADGVPLPGAGNLYVTDAITKLDVDPQWYQSPEITVPNGSGQLCVVFKPLPVLKWVNLAVEFCRYDPELEHMMVGGELFTKAGYSVGGSAPAVGAFGAPNGVSLEVWSEHIVDGDIAPIYPYIRWVFPRSKWTPAKFSIDQNHMPRPLDGFTSQNPNWFNGPGNDWTYSSDRSYAHAYDTSIPTPQCGAQTLAAS